MKKEFKNPVWSALSETHKDLAISYQGVKFYNPEVCNFGAIEGKGNVSSFIDEYAKLTDNFYIVSKERPVFNQTLNLNKEVKCYQMILEKLIVPKITFEIIQLDAKYIDEVFNLISLVMPGYYKKKTFNLGKYYGVFVADKLVAVTGERLQSSKFIEVSGVVTHPDFTGKGFAKQLVAHTVSNILQQHKTPILHVGEDNQRAIGLYEKLGFKINDKIVWRHFTTKNK